MAFTTIKNYITYTFRDERDNERVRICELGGLVVATDDNANDMHLVSKSAVVKYVQNNVQHDDLITPDAGSEVRDTLRLYFRLPDQSVAHFDIPDPKDALFVAQTGAGANIALEKSVLDAADPLAGADEEAQSSLGDIIDDVLAGEYLISDGEQPVAYLRGERVTWR